MFHKLISKLVTHIIDKYYVLVIPRINGKTYARIYDKYFGTNPKGGEKSENNSQD